MNNMEKKMTDQVPPFAYLIAETLGSRKSVYLDTNIWSELARNMDLRKSFSGWLADSGNYVVLSRFQLAEFSGDTRIHGDLAGVITALNPIFVDRGQHEFTGTKYSNVSHDLYVRFDITAKGFHQELMALLGSPEIYEARNNLSVDAEKFGIQLHAAIESNSAELGSWDKYAGSMERWLRQRCELFGVSLHADGIRDAERYIGIKLSHAVLYWRYVINRQKWSGRNDYLDYLHSADMAYAKVVVTERNLRECLRQIGGQKLLIVPDEIYDISWLRALPGGI